MAVKSFTKIRIAGLMSSYKPLMQELHRRGNIEIIQGSEISQAASLQDPHFDLFDLSRIENVIHILSQETEDKKSFLSNIFSGGKIVISEQDSKMRVAHFGKHVESYVHQCEEASAVIAEQTHKLNLLHKQRKILEPYQKCFIPIGGDLQTDNTYSWIGHIAVARKDDFIRELSKETCLVDIDVFTQIGDTVYVRLTCFKKLTEKVQGICEEVGFVFVNLEEELGLFAGMITSQAIKQIDKEFTGAQELVKKARLSIRELGNHLQDFQIFYDYQSWKKKKNDIQQDIFYSKSIFAFEAWTDEEEFPLFHKWIKNAFPEGISVEKMELEASDQSPVSLKNNYVMSSFEPIVEMYGLPKKSDIDPTVFMAPFFFLFFGICLSDVGYGLIMLLSALAFMIFGKVTAEGKNKIFLLVLCGFSAIIGGIVLGGYFGMTPLQAPLFLINPETGAFYGQLLNPMEGAGPIQFLLIALSLGVIQLLFGILLDFIRHLKNHDPIKAFADSLPWFLLVSSLLVWGITGYSGEDASIWRNITLLSVAILVFTQGRDQKNWLLKPVFGLLSLYNITGYLSDILSYSRIMALGLATGVIAFAMNMTAGVLGEMITTPVLGTLVMIIVILFGHTLNIFLSVLGAFIHSGRLQFIEFFGKFYTGGAKAFKPFLRKNRFLFFEK